MKKSLTPSEIRKRITPVLKSHGIKRAALFGSAARGEMKAKSDVDVLIEPGPHFSLLDLVALKHDLEDTVGRSVDVVIRGSESPYMRDRILGEAQPVYG